MRRRAASSSGGVGTGTYWDRSWSDRSLGTTSRRRQTDAQWVVVAPSSTALARSKATAGATRHRGWKET